MSASREGSEFVEPQPRPPRSEPSAEASTSLLPLANSTPASQIELLGNDDAGAGADANSSTSRAQAHTNGLTSERDSSADSQTAPRKQSSPPHTSSSKSKIFLKSTSPNVPLRFFLTPELPHSSTRTLTVHIRNGSGIVVTTFAKADLIVADPNHSTSKKHLRNANQLPEPVPVVSMDYIRDSISQGTRLDPQDPKYKFDGGNLQVAAGTVRSKTGRNAFTESDREAVINYFIDKPQESWSLNDAARELSQRIPTHTHSSFQTYLRDNFEKGWNLKDKILASRLKAIEAGPSELQARIFRSQYTASPSLAEQSAPSDGWPRLSPQPESKAEASSLAEDDDDEDLQVRRPEPGSTLDNVERSPTKVKQTVDHPSSEHSSLGTSPPLSLSLVRRAPDTTAYENTPSAAEESDPEDYSPRILGEIALAEKSRSKPSQKAKQVSRRARHSSDSSDDSELEESGSGKDDTLLTTGRPKRKAAPRSQAMAPDSEESEWEGSRRLDRKAREKHLKEVRENGNQPVEYQRAKFEYVEKEALRERLCDYVMAQGQRLPASTQAAMLAKPDDAFWQRLAAEYPRHSAASWRSHYLKNRQPYEHAVNVLIEDRTAGDQDSEDEGEREVDGSPSSENPHNQGEDQQQPLQPNRPEQASLLSQTAKAAGDHAKMRGSRSASYISRDVSIHADGIVVAIPLDPSQQPSNAHTRVDEHQQAGEVEQMERQEEQEVDEEGWPDVPPPPPIEDEEEDDAMQVEAETDAVPTSPVTMDEDEEEVESEVDQLVEPAVDAPSADEESNSSASAASLALAKLAVHHQESVSTAAASKAASRMAATPTSSSRSRQNQVVEAGTPVLAQHRAATFYDFTMDSDEEERIRKARSRPSLPSLQSHVRESSPRLRRAPVTSHRVASHLATPRRSLGEAAKRRIQLPERGQEDDRAARTREWARSVSAESSSASPEGFGKVEPVAVTQSSRSRASRIDRGPIPGATRADDTTPTRQPDRPQKMPRLSTGPSPAALTFMSPQASGRQMNEYEATSNRSATRSGIDIARQQYRAEVERFRKDYDLDKVQLRSLLMRFKASVRDARSYIADWLGEMENSYGVDAAVAFEYVKTSQGDFQQAETFLKLAAVTRSHNTPDRSRQTLSRSPSKRQKRDDDLSFNRVGRGSSVQQYRR